LAKISLQNSTDYMTLTNHRFERKPVDSRGLRDASNPPKPLVSRQMHHGFPDIGPP
jgi:hypothetical protein